MNPNHFGVFLPLVLMAVSALLSLVEIYAFDVDGYLTARLETWLLLVFVALYVYLVSKHVLSHVKVRLSNVFVVLSGGGAHLIGSGGGVVLWLMVDRLARRTAFGGFVLGLSDWSGELSINLLGLLAILVCSLIYLMWIPFLLSVVVSITVLFGCYMGGFFEGARLPERLEERVVFISRKLRDARVGLPVFSRQEQVILQQYWTDRGFQTLSEMRLEAVAPDLKQAFYWCLRDRIDCRYVENAISGDSTEFPRTSLQIGFCDDLADLAGSELLAHRGVTSVSLGGKGRPCEVLSTSAEIESLFPDLQALEVNEPRENLLRELPDHVTSLSVRMGEISAGVLEAIGQHRKIVNLKLSTQFLPESAFFYLSTMESLHTLWLRGKGLSGNRLQGAELSSLRELKLGPGSSLSLIDLRHLERLNLDRLEIFSDTLTKENVDEVVSRFPAPPREVIVQQYEFPLPENSNLPSHLKEMLIQQIKRESEW
jgi:hypothetical protein